MQNKIYKKTGITMNVWAKMSAVDRIAKAESVLGKNSSAVALYRARWTR